MILIRKGREPEELQRYRCLPDSEYDNMPKEVKEAVLAALCDEQHHLCAYCTCRIPEEDAKKHNQPPVTIEHFYPRNPENGEIREKWDLRYGNMHAVCSGNRGCGSREALTCDASKGNSVIQSDPCIETVISKICYRTDGTIYAEDDAIDAELNFALNLNCKERSLPLNRKAALDELKKWLHRDPAKFRQNCRKILDTLHKCPSPFCGMSIAWLEKHV